MIQISDVETKFQAAASTAIANLDAAALHNLANELDRILAIVASLSSIGAGLGITTIAPAPVVIPETPVVEP
jgi:hypothetical protein